MIIGVFDSGRGGLVMADELRSAFPDHEFITKTDEANVPYGSKTPEEVYELTRAGVQVLIDRGAEIIVLACNTATTTISHLRETFTIPIIGLEPMIKPAAGLTKTGIISVLATPATLASKRYQELKAEYASNITVLEPNCSTWSSMVEQDTIDWDEIKKVANHAVAAGADVIVLGCTHYHLLEDYLIEHCPNTVKILQPSQAIIARLKVVLTELTK